MRAVELIYLLKLKGVIRATIDQVCVFRAADEWCWPDVDRAVLRVSLCSDFSDWEPSDLNALREALGEPHAFVSVAVSGTIAGNCEVKNLLMV